MIKREINDLLRIVREYDVCSMILCKQHTSADLKHFYKQPCNKMITYKLKNKYVTMSKSTLALAPKLHLTFLG